MKKIILIGGSSGISKSFVELYAENYQIKAFNRNATSIEHKNVTNYSFDVLKDDLIIDESCDALVYAPGSIVLKPFKNLSQEDFLADFEINVLGAVKSIKKVLPLLNKNGLSSIVLFSTIAVSLGMPYHASVAAAKGAVEGLGKSLAAELAPHIRVNIIAPSITDTPLASKILGNDKARENAKNRHPLKKIGDPKDAAHLINFLVSDQAQWISGQVFHLDGGMSTLKLL